MRIILSFLFIVLSFSSYAQGFPEESLAYQYYQQGSYDKAAEIFQKLFNKDKNENYFDLYFSSLVKGKKLKEAEDLTKMLNRQYPDKLNYQLALGKIYLELGKNTEANKIFLKAIENSAKEEYAYRDLANLFYKYEAYDLAIQAFLQGRKILNNDALYIYELINLYRYKKDKPMLVQEYVNALTAEPTLYNQAQTVLASILEDNADYMLLQSAILKKLQKDPGNDILNSLLTWQFIQQRDYESALRQLIAQDRRNSGTGMAIYSAANIFLANNAYNTATKAYEYLVSKGSQNELYLPSQIQLINARYEMAMNAKPDSTLLKSLAAQFNDIINQHGLNTKTLFAAKKLANIEAYHLKSFSKAEAMLEQALKIPNLPALETAQLKLDLGDIYLLNKEPWEALLMYEQVSKSYENQPIGSEARFKSARLSFFQGNFKFAKSQADVLKASTSQLIANDALNLSLLISDNLQNKNDSLALIMYADAELLLFTNQTTEALTKLDSIHSKYPGNSLSDDILLSKAKIYTKTTQYDLAVKQLNDIISNYYDSIWIDDAIFMLADLYEKKLHQNEEAAKLYQKLITDFPGSMLNSEARKRFRNLRGDNVIP
ncbi:tetratricopeptide repeat protein [Pedobacter montanisoli]|uniref:Tetratricopeptide repeat protein n=1 Tax=Pedobacter montanisoli TaxID=2923277 RepID=A0ABS9ZRT2_9SPHI|nr:tetratricopeptide repeat protein [Pedobacter montanisoli]MCJ0741228.1 tetratricopeptide repeat protein [Pedobacter montanisoli]